MPDITMCSGDRCPLKYTCYRFLAEPNQYRQSFFYSPPFEATSDNTEFTCKYYWKEEDRGK